MDKVQIIECPRDAMQGWKHLISTPIKVEYLNFLLKIGFDTIDFGSFVSARAIPQMADTPEVLNQLARPVPAGKLLAIVANARGAETAVQYPEVAYLGYPFSVSETFQQRNAHSTIAESLDRVRDVQDLCLKHGKRLVVYLSMGFGNPYGDAWSPDMVADWGGQMAKLGVTIISVADTVGLATPDQVFSLTDRLIRELPRVTIGVHLHSRPDGMEAKLDAALAAGCRRIDSALKGIGGCPMAGDELVGNLDTERVVTHLRNHGYATGIDLGLLEEAGRRASAVFAG